MAQPAPSPIPEGMSTLTMHLWFNGNGGEAVDFYQKAFGAKVVDVEKGPQEKSLMHAQVRIGDTNLMMADAWPGSWEQGPDGSASAGLWLFVEDADALYGRAVAAGCEVVTEIMDAFWGDRMGKVKDPFGHCWAIASRRWVLTPEEVEERKQAWIKSRGWRAPLSTPSVGASLPAT